MKFSSYQGLLIFFFPEVECFTLSIDCTHLFDLIYCKSLRKGGLTDESTVLLSAGNACQDQKCTLYGLVETVSADVDKHGRGS